MNPKKIPNPIGALQELMQTAEKAKVKLTPEILGHAHERTAAAQAKLARGEQLTKEDVAFIGEIKRMIELEKFKQIELPAQYGKRLETLSFFGFLDEKGETKKGDAPVPTREQALAVFTPEMLELAYTFQEPTLLLVPETSFAAKVNAIDRYKTMEGQQDTYVDEMFKDPAKAYEKITGWRAVIVDGARDMKLKEGDDVELTFTERIRNRKAARKPGEMGVDRHIEAILMLCGLLRGEPVDWKTYTLLDDDPALSNSLVPLVRWINTYHQVGFVWDAPDDVGDQARLRSSVGGVVPT